MIVMSKKQKGFTLVEVLIASVITLILLGVMIRIFAQVGAEVSKGRALLEMAGQLRTTTDLLRRDLAGKTTTGLSGFETGSASGYFEILEGFDNDNTTTAARQGVLNDNSGAFGDVDDVLMFTSQNFDNPFRGRFQYFDAGGNLQTRIVESNYAEIIWWTVFDDLDNDGLFDANEPMRLYRRVLLIRPGIMGIMPVGSTLPHATDKTVFNQYCDISVTTNPVTGLLEANSMASLSRRENRFGRFGPVVSPFPSQVNHSESGLVPGGTALCVQRPSVTNENLNRYILQRQFLDTDPNAGADPENPYSGAGEDLMLSGIAAFDLKVFDPTARKSLFTDPVDPTQFIAAMTPADPGYTAGASAPGSAVGTFVDLGYDTTLGTAFNSEFSGNPVAQSFVSHIFPTKWAYTYDTWSKSYGSDQINQDGDATTDEILETFPPYPVPLRGIQVSIRLLEPKTQTIRQSSVVSNFIPE